MSKLHPILVALAVGLFFGLLQYTTLSIIP